MSIKLLTSWRIRDLPAFKEALEDDDVLPNYQYPEEAYRNLLESIADTVSSESAAFASILIQKGASVDLMNQLNGRAPIHAAVEALNTPVLEVLLSSNADVNIQTSDGSTVLHLLARKVAENKEKAQEQCLELILSTPDVYLNHVDRNGKTAVVKAYEQKAWKVLAKLIKAGSVIENFDYAINGGPSMKQEIMKRFPEVLDHLPEVLVVKNPLVKSSNYHQLLSLLDNSNQDRFCYEFNIYMADTRNRNLVSSQFECGQLLERAIVLGCHKAATTLVEFIVSNEFNKSLPARFQKEVFTACLVGDHKILELLLKHDDQAAAAVDNKHRTVLHVLAEVSPFTGNYLTCWNILKPWILSENPKIKLNVSAADQFGKTPLHVSGFTRNNDFTEMLLSAGANIFAVDVFGLAAWESIPNEIISRYLNEKISRKLDTGEVFFDLRFVNPNTGSKAIENEPLIFGGSKLKESEMLSFQSFCNPNEAVVEKASLILTHPVVVAFFRYKWRMSRLFYYFEVGSLALYTILAMLLFKYACSPFEFGVFLQVALCPFLICQYLKSGVRLAAAPLDFLTNPSCLLRLFAAFLMTMILPLGKCSSQQSWHYENFATSVLLVLITFFWFNLLSKHPCLSLPFFIVRSIARNYLRTFYLYIIVFFTIAFALNFSYDSLMDPIFESPPFFAAILFWKDWEFHNALVVTEYYKLVIVVALVHLVGLGISCTLETLKNKEYYRQRQLAGLLFDIEDTYLLFPRSRCQVWGKYISTRVFSYYLEKLANRILCFYKIGTGLVCLTGRDNVIVGYSKEEKATWWDPDVRLERKTVEIAHEALESLKPPLPEPESPLQDIEQKLSRISEMMVQVKAALAKLEHSEKEMESLLIQSLRINSLRAEEDLL